jgi:hypothetical protein
MDNTTNASSMPQQELSALMDRLLTIAQAHQVQAVRQGDSGIRLEFDQARVTVCMDPDNGLLLVECASNAEEEPEVLSTCMPIAATQGDQGPANVFEFAEMLVMLLGFKPVPETAAQ